MNEAYSASSRPTPLPPPTPKNVQPSFLGEHLGRLEGMTNHLTGLVNRIEGRLNDIIGIAPVEVGGLRAGEDYPSLFERIDRQTSDLAGHINRLEQQLTRLDTL